MSKLTLLDLLQCFGWSALAFVPLGCAYIAGKSAYKKDDDAEVFLPVALIVQVFFGVLCYKAGGK